MVTVVVNTSPGFASAGTVKYAVPASAMTNAGLSTVNVVPAGKERSPTCGRVTRAPGWAWVWSQNGVCVVARDWPTVRVVSATSFVPSGYVTETDTVCSPGTEVSGLAVHSMWVPGGKVSALMTAVAAAGASTNCFVNTGRVSGW